MKKQILQILSLVLVAVLCVGCGGNGNTARPPLNADFAGAETTFSFSAAPSEAVQLSEEGAAAVLTAVEQTVPAYPYQEFYALEEVKNRLDFDASVESHLFSALNSEGTLEAGHLATQVKQNNEAFMATDPFGYKPVEDDYLQDLCAFIVTVMDKMVEKYPDVDWNRVYCNLGNLKILYKTGMLSFAEVSPEMILSVSKNNTSIVLNLKGDDGFTRVMTHEIMHIIQIGCSCENIENAGRRAGIAMYWDDFTLNTADWSWMAEGSAERHMCTLTGGEAISYQYKIDYLCSMTMSVLLRDSVKADTMETLCFYDDPQLLFDTFGCETEEARDELIKLMVTMQILQMNPEPFHLEYTKKTGIDLRKDSETENQFYYALKPDVCITLSKVFYKNLVTFLQNNRLTQHDLFFLINLFEGHLNQHLTFTNAAKAEINRPFLQSYTVLRDTLFTALSQDTGADIKTMYQNYEIETGDTLLNAELSMLSKEKRTFLAERAQWQSENLGLGIKVP